MDIINNIILGIVQGITEFFPISSSGHLLLVKSFLNMRDEGIYREVFFHGGTLLSILIYYKQDIRTEYDNVLIGKYHYLLSVIFATIPAACIGLIFKDVIELKFMSPDYYLAYLAISFLFTSFILLLTKFSINYDIQKITYTSAIIIGIAQVMALFPGISRSGMTIAMALFLGINMKESAKFSFMLAIPIISFAFLQSVFISYDKIADNFFPMFFGFLASTITGYFVISSLINIVKKKKLWSFSIYCFAIFLTLIINDIWNIL